MDVRPSSGWETIRKRSLRVTWTGTTSISVEIQIGGSSCTQGSHEAFHRVCGERKNAMHWADEMFAVFFSLLYLERIGEIAHANKNRIGLINGAQRISRRKMLTITQGPLPDGFYGQVYLLGEELRQIVDWETLKDLATLRTAEGAPDVEGWIASLTTEVREKAARVVLGSGAP